MPSSKPQVMIPTAPSGNISLFPLELSLFLCMEHYGTTAVSIKVYLCALTDLSEV